MNSEGVIKKKKLKSNFLRVFILLFTLLYADIPDARADTINTSKFMFLKILSQTVKCLRESWIFIWANVR